MASRVAIVFCGDRNGALPMTVALRSVARHSSRPVDYSVVTADMDQEQREKLASCVNRAGGDTIRFVDPGQTFAGFPPGPNNSHANYYRIVLPEVLQDVSRALYFDADLLVRVDVAELWDRVVSSTAPVQACQDASPSYICDATLPVYAEYGLQLGAPYYNAGVLGLDLDVLRREKLTQQMLAFVERHGAECPYHEQGAINALLGSRIDRLPRTWNSFSLLAAPDAKIVHYSTWRKPFVRPRMRLERADWVHAAWHVAMADDLHYREYFSVLDETPYARWRPYSPSVKLMRSVPKAVYPLGRAFFACANSVRRTLSRSR